MLRLPHSTQYNKLNILYALLILSPSLNLPVPWQQRLRVSQVISSNLNDQNANSFLLTCTSSFPPTRFLKKMGIWPIKRNHRVWLLIYTYLGQLWNYFMHPDVYCLSYPLTHLAWDYLTQWCRCFQVSSPQPMTSLPPQTPTVVLMNCAYPLFPTCMRRNT